MTLGYVYRLVCSDVDVKEIYVGSTDSLRNRKATHKCACTNPDHDDYNFLVYRYIREHGGWDNWIMVVIETFEYNEKYELKTRERYWIETLHATLNCQIPTRTKAEYYQDNADAISEQSKLAYAANPEPKKASAKQYALTHQEEVKAHKKQYYAANAETIAETQKAYYEENKNVILAKQSEYFQCECGKQITIGKKSRHVLSARHLTAVGATITEPVIAVKLEQRKEKERKQRVKDSEYITCECGQQITRNKLNRHRSSARHLALLTAAQTLATPNIPVALTPTNDNGEPGAVSV